MNREIFVYVDLSGEPRLAGTLWTRSRRGVETASFEYSQEWLADPDRFSLEPALALDPGAHHTGRALFGSIGDSAPDRWGRTLMRRAERILAQKEGRAPRTLQEADFLLLVNDEARLGALRFAEAPGGPFLAAGGTAIPPLIDLGRLLAASESVEDDEEDDDQLDLLLAPGSSLGGARPKASVRDKNNALAIAKFPHKQDEWNVVKWERVALELASRAGIRAARSRIEQVAHKDVLILERFDRQPRGRIAFLSAMSMLGAGDGEAGHSYLDIADSLRQYGAAPADDIAELWRRVVFNILISNTDDHLRNHGFLHQGGVGWRLSPAYDLNPVPVDVRPRTLTTLIDSDDGTASLELAFSVAEYFGLEQGAALQVAREVGQAVSTWRQVAAQESIPKAEITRMASAFDHADLKTALAIKVSM